MNTWTVEMLRPFTGQKEKVNVEYEMTDTWPEPIEGIWQSDKVPLNEAEFKIARLLFYNARNNNLGEMIANPKQASLSKILNKIKREKLYREPEHSPIINDDGKESETLYSAGTDPGAWAMPARASIFTLEELEGETLVKNAELNIVAKIVKRDNEYCVVSKKGKTLGCYPSKVKAVKRLKQVETFKHMKKSSLNKEATTTFHPEGESSFQTPQRYRQQLKQKSPQLINEFNLGGSREHVWGDAKNVTGNASGIVGDVTYLTGVIDYRLKGLVNGISGDVSNILGDCSNIRGDVSNISGWVDNISGYVAKTVEGDVTNLSGVITNLYGDVSNIKGDASNLQGVVTNLDGNVSGIIGKINLELSGNVSHLKGDISNITGKVNRMLYGDISGIRGDVSNIVGNVNNIYGDVSNILGNVSSIRGDVSNTTGDVSNMTGEVSNELDDQFLRVRKESAEKSPSILIKRRLEEDGGNYEFWPETGKILEGDLAYILEQIPPEMKSFIAEVKKLDFGQSIDSSNLKKKERETDFASAKKYDFFVPGEIMNVRRLDIKGNGDYIVTRSDGSEKRYSPNELNSIIVNVPFEQKEFLFAIQKLNLGESVDISDYSKISTEHLLIETEAINKYPLEGDKSKIWGISSISGDIGSPSRISGNVNLIKGDASKISGDVSNIRGTVSNIKGDVSNIKGDVSNISGDVSSLSGDVTKLHGDVTGVQGDASNPSKLKRPILTPNEDRTLINAKNLQPMDSENPIWGDAKNIRGDPFNIRGFVSNLSGDISYLSGDVSNIFGDVSNISGNVSNLKGDVSNLKGRISERVTGDVSKIEGNFSSEIFGDVSNISGDITGFSGDTTNMSGPITKVETDQSSSEVKKLINILNGKDIRLDGDLGGEVRYIKKGDIVVSEIYNGNIWGNAAEIWGTVTELTGDISHISGDVSNIRGDVRNIRGNVSNISGDVSYIDGDVTNLKGYIYISGDISNISGDVSNISGDVSKLKGDVSSLAGNVSHLEGDVSTLKDKGVIYLSS